MIRGKASDAAFQFKVSFSDLEKGEGKNNLGCVHCLSSPHIPMIAPHPQAAHQWRESLNYLKIKLIIGLWAYGENTKTSATASKVKWSSIPYSFEPQLLFCMHFSLHQENKFSCLHSFLTSLPSTASQPLRQRQTYPRRGWHTPHHTSISNPADRAFWITGGSDSAEQTEWGHKVGCFLSQVRYYHHHSAISCSHSCFN